MGIFVGRDHELRALDALLDAAMAGEGNVALVSGEPGVGKTRLVEELTRRAEARGFVVTWGRSWEGEGTPAYYPWLQVLRRLRGKFGTLFDAACASSPELGVLLDEVRGAAHGDPAEARFRLFDAVSELLRRAAEESPIAIVLDDLHAADLSTLRWGPCPPPSSGRRGRDEEGGDVRRAVGCSWRTDAMLNVVLTVRARVKNGRLVLDEPTDLPEGTEVELATMEDEPWELTREQHAELAARLASADRGQLVPAAEVFARLRGG
jgi:hypothetical protein